MKVLYFFILIQIIRCNNYKNCPKAKPPGPIKVSVPFSVSDKYYPGCPVDKGSISL